MPDPSSPGTWIGALLLIIGFAIGTWLRIGPGKQISAMADAMLGTAEVKDRSGKVSLPAQPGLVHRTNTLEESVKTLIELVAEQRVIATRVDLHETRLNDHDTSIAALIASTFERGAHATLTAAEIQAAKARQEKS